MKPLSTVLLTLVLGCILVACGDNGPTDPDPGPPEPSVSAVVVSPDEAELEIEETVSLNAEVEGDDGVSQAVAWTSSDAGVADVDDSGVVTGIGEGTATIRATSNADSDVHGEAVITVLPQPSVSAVVVSPDEAEIQIEETVSLNAEVEGDTGVSQAVTWTSSDADVADVDDAGVVTGIGEGTATIRATSDADADVHGEAVITVLPPGVACGNANELSDDITADTTLPRDCYLVTDNITISAALTIQPGTVLRFVRTSGFRIADSGSLHAVGTAADSITLTSDSGEPNDWRGVGIFASTESVLDYVVIENAGIEWNAINSSTSTNLYVHDNARVAITNSAFRTSGGFGVYLNNAASSILTAFDDNSFDGNASPPIRLFSSQLHMIGSGNTFGTNAPVASRFIAVRSSTVDTTQTWQNLDVPYRFFGNHFIDDPDAVVTIDAGTTLEFERTAGLRVNAGTLLATGGAGEPITLTSASREPNDWRGLGIASNTGNVLEHVVIENAGIEWTVINSSESTNLYVDENAQVAITNSTFRTGGGHGIYLDDPTTSVLNAFDDNTFDGNADAPLRLYSSQIGMIGSGNTFGTNAPLPSQFVQVAATTVRTNQIWQNLDIPYRFFGFHFVEEATAVVEIEPGTTLQFVDGAGIRVNAGALSAVGTADERILMTSVGGDPGDWSGIAFNSSSADNALQYVTAENAGATWQAINNGNPGNLYVTSVGRVVVTNSAFDNSSGWGIFNEGTITNEDGVAIDPATQGGNTFSGNDNGDVGS